MKHAMVAVLGLLCLLLLLIAALLFKQGRLAADVRAVQDENARLSQELSTRPPISSAEVAQAQQRLERAEVIMDAVEKRLTNSASVLATLQQAARGSANAVPSSRVTANPVRPPPAARGDIPEISISDSIPLLATPEPLVPSSSHTPDGQLQHRSWGPEQVIGPPDTHQAGDIPTAWAPLNSQGQSDEWLHLNYEKPVDIAQVNVRETYNPGAISKVAAVMPDGREVVVWEGTEPPAAAPVDMSFAVPAGVQAQSVRIYLDRTRVSGWNEIDAVELVGQDGSRQWATSAKASSSYAERGGTVAAAVSP